MKASVVINHSINDLGSSIGICMTSSRHLCLIPHESLSLFQNFEVRLGSLSDTILSASLFSLNMHAENEFGDSYALSFPLKE